MTNFRVKTPKARPVDSRDALPSSGKVWLFNAKNQSWGVVKAHTVRLLHQYSSEKVYWAPLSASS